MCWPQCLTASLTCTCIPHWNCMKNRRGVSPGLLDLYMKHRPRISPENIELCSRQEVGIVGFPITYKEAVPEKANREIIKQQIDCLLIDDDTERLEASIGPRVHGVKMHHKIMNQQDGFSQMAAPDKMNFLESNNMCLLIEVPDHVKEIQNIIETAGSYKVNIILPHMAFNHTGFHMERGRFIESFSKYDKSYDVLKKLTESPNIYLDIAMKADFDLIMTGIQAIGEDRIFYGSDYPYCLTRRDRQLVL